MATLNLNNQKIFFNEELFFNIKSLLPQLQRKFPTTDYQFECFEVNGAPLDFNSDHPDLIRPIESQDSIHLNIVAKRKPEQVLLDHLTQLTTNILSKINQCVIQLKENHLDQAYIELSLIIEAIDTFSEVSSYFGSDQDNIELLPYKSLQIHLLSVMKAILAAYSKEDTITLTDLLEYELKDNLTQWKIHIFTSLKRKN